MAQKKSDEKHCVFLFDPDVQGPHRRKWLIDLADGKAEEKGLTCVRYQSESGNCLYKLEGMFTPYKRDDCYLFNLADGYILEVYMGTDGLIRTSSLKKQGWIGL